MVKGNWEEIERFIEDTGNQKAGWFAKEKGEKTAERNPVVRTNLKY